MKYSKALVVLNSVLVGVWSAHTVDDLYAGHWGWAVAHGFLGLGSLLVVRHYLDNLKRKDQ